MSREPRVILIGVGTDYRSDDAVGLVVARRVNEKVSGKIKVIEHSGEGASLMEAWEWADTAIIIDAVSSGAEAGKIYRFEAHAEPIPTRFFRYSTHAFSIAESIELARVLDRLPPRLIVYGIEGKNFDAGIGLLPEVEVAADEVGKRVMEEI